MPDTIKCPKCDHQFELTETLAAPLLESAKKQFEAALKEKDAQFAKRESALNAREIEIAQKKERLDDELNKRVKGEREKIAIEEAKKAKLAFETDLDQKTKAVNDLEAVIKTQNAKLAESQKAEAEFKKKERELDDAKRELDLTLEKRLAESQAKIREKALKDAEEALRLKVDEKEKIISDMQSQIEDLKRKSEQGSQQLQGEVLELQLEKLLASKYPRDTVEPVPKGTHGGDIVHRISNPLGAPCGTILWEIKRTKNWSDGWLAKLRDDQRAAKAELSVIVSQALPKDVEHFDRVENVWVVHPRCVLPVAEALRNSLIEISLARGATEGQQTKMEMIYEYLTSPRFRHRIEAIVEAFSTMHEDLEKEKRAIIKQWAKREEQISRVTQATVGMYGDLQGIAGKSIQEIEGLEVLSLEES